MIDIKKSIVTSLEVLIEKHKEEEILLGDLVISMEQWGFALLMLVLVLPNCVPVPVPPGVSTVFSLPLLFFAGQMALGFSSPWLPYRLKQLKIKRKFILRAIELAKPRLEKLEKNSQPRFSFLFTKYGEMLIGAVWIVFSLSIAVPMPLTNFLPGVGILVSALGLLRRDGIMLFSGFIVGSVGIIITLLLLTIGATAISKIFS